MEARPKLHVGIRELRSHLTRYLNEARGGPAILVTSRDSVIAEIHPTEPETLPPRRPGSLRGQIWMAEDFDTWPRWTLDSFES